MCQRSINQKDINKNVDHRLPKKANIQGTDLEWCTVFLL